jgi:hypothetical protein
MKILTVAGDPHGVNAIMVSKTEEFHDHDVVRLSVRQTAASR